MKRFMAKSFRALALVAAVMLGLVTKAANNAPAFANGTFIYRACTTDAADGCLTELEQGFELVSKMLDGDIRQVPIINGIVGHDHKGGWNWDGLWPYLPRATFRAGNSLDKLHDFSWDALTNANTWISFHVNVTDVNLGLADYPESLAFFRRLVETKSIYRRDYNPQVGKRDGEPYTMTEEQLLAERANGNPIDICSLVNYKKFWDSGLAKEVIDDLYKHLAKPPPVLYLDVLNEQGGNFTTGFPEGGSFETQQEGATNICAYLRSLGTEVGTEGQRDYFLGEYGTYGWLHCDPGYAPRDYSRIWGAPKIYDRIAYMHVLGNTGGFAVSPVGMFQPQIEKDILHYNTLLKGEVSPRVMPTAKTFFIASRGSDNDEYNQIPGLGGGDGLRGDWIDAINNFYLVSIQELYHIGKGNNRTDEYLKFGANHFNGIVITDPDGVEKTLQLADDMEIPNGVDRTRAMLEWCRHWKFNAPKAGTYKIELEGYYTGASFGGSQVYVDGSRLFRSLETIFPDKDETKLSRIDCGTIELTAGEHTFDMDAGPIKAAWDDGTVSVFEEPALNRGFTCSNNLGVVFAYDYDRMWPDTWSGKLKIHFFSWNGTSRTWKLPADWEAYAKVSLYPLTPNGRGPRQDLDVTNGTVTPTLLKQVPYVLVPYEAELPAGISAETIAALPTLTAAKMSELDAAALSLLGQTPGGEQGEEQGGEHGEEQGGEQGEEQGGEQGGEQDVILPVQTNDGRIKFLGCDTSVYKWTAERNDPANWNDVKCFWRSTSTAQKAYVLSGNANAYGTDGYLCATYDNLTLEPDGSAWRGALYTGTRTGDKFGGITDYASIEVVSNNLNGTSALFGDPDARYDNPTDEIAATCPSLVTGADIIWSFGEPDNVWESTAVDAMKITFNELAVLHPTVRIGFAATRGDDCAPYTIAVRDGAGNLCGGKFLGDSEYGRCHWTFFEIVNPEPGETLTVVLTNRKKSRSAAGDYSQFSSLSIVAFDSVSIAGSDDLPQVTSATANPSAPEIGSEPVTVTLSATAENAQGGELTYEWKASGTQPGEYEFTTPSNAATCSVSLKAKGDYKFIVKVTNADGYSNFSSPVTISVKQQSVVPTEKSVGFLGMEVSSQNRYSGSVSEYSGKKGAWRSTGTTAKPYVIEGNPNAYGLDGYICGTRDVYEQEVQGTDWQGLLYTGTREAAESPAVARFPTLTTYASVELLNNGKNGNVYLFGNDDAATVDSPLPQVSESIGQVVKISDLAWPFASSDAQGEVDAMRITFNDDVVDHPVIRIGFVTDRCRSQNLTAIIVRGADVGSVTGEVAEVRNGDYGYINWTFFEVLNAEPGDTLTVSLRNARNDDGATWCGWGMIGLVTFDSRYTGSNAAPEITSVSATPSAAVYANWKAEAMLQVQATDADGDELTYAWKTDGVPPSSCTFSDPSAASCKVTMGGVGTYSFRVSVTDGKGAPVVSEAVTVTVTAGPGSGYAEFVGTESTLVVGPGNGYSPMVGDDAKNYPWGPWNSGNKCSYRSLAAGDADAEGRKAFVFEGNPNAYGVDGYVFPSDNKELDDTSCGPLSSGTVTAETLAFTNVTPYLTAVEFNTSAIQLNGDGYGRGGCYWIDDPRVPLADWVEDIKVGWLAFKCQTGDFTKIATLAFGGKVRHYERIRVGLLCGFGEGWRPIRVSVGGRRNDWVTVNGDYCKPDWQFFDLVGVASGDRVDIEVMGSAVDKVAIDGIVFDSKPAKAPGLFMYIR